MLERDIQNQREAEINLADVPIDGLRRVVSFFNGETFCYMNVFQSNKIPDEMVEPFAVTKRVETTTMVVGEPVTMRRDVRGVSDWRFLAQVCIDYDLDITTTSRDPKEQAKELQTRILAHLSTQTEAINPWR